MWEWVPSPPREGSETGLAPSQEKVNLKWCVSVYSERYFVRAFVREIVTFLLEVIVCRSLFVGVDDVLILEILKHYKIWETNCIRVLPLKSPKSC